MNDIEVDLSDVDLVETVLSVAQGKMSKAAVAEFFRKHTRG
jgi:hypothetical protein